MDTNLAAFRHGRHLVAQPRTEDTAPAAPVDLDELIAHRTAELTAYQDARYADTFAQFVHRVRTREDQVLPGSTQLTEAVARHLFSSWRTRTSTRSPACR